MERIRRDICREVGSIKQLTRGHNIDADGWVDGANKNSIVVCRFQDIGRNALAKGVFAVFGSWLHRDWSKLELELRLLFAPVLRFQ